MTGGEHSKPTQRDRVLAALQRAGRWGITKVDFQLPDVIDGGPPILHVGGRINELCNQGYKISRPGRRDKCVVYRLDQAPAAVGTPPASGPAAPPHRSPSGGAAGPPTQIDDVPPLNAIFDYDDEAA